MIILILIYGLEIWIVDNKQDLLFLDYFLFEKIQFQIFKDILDVYIKLFIIVVLYEFE